MKSTIAPANWDVKGNTGTRSSLEPEIGRHEIVDLVVHAVRVANGVLLWGEGMRLLGRLALVA